MEEKITRRRFLRGTVIAAGVAVLGAGIYSILPEKEPVYSSIAEAVRDCSERGFSSRTYWLDDLTVKEIKSYPDRPDLILTLTDGKNQLTAIAVPQKSERRTKLIGIGANCVPMFAETTDISGTIGYDVIRRTEPGDRVHVRLFSVFPEGDYSKSLDSMVGSIKFYINRSLIEGRPKKG